MISGQIVMAMVHYPTESSQEYNDSVVRSAFWAVTTMAGAYLELTLENGYVVELRLENIISSVTYSHSTEHVTTEFPQDRAAEAFQRFGQYLRPRDLVFTIRIGEEAHTLRILRQANGDLVVEEIDDESHNEDAQQPDPSPTRASGLTKQRQSGRGWGGWEFWR